MAVAVFVAVVLVAAIRVFSVAAFVASVAGNREFQVVHIILSGIGKS